MSPADKPDQAELLRQFEAQLAGMPPADMRELLDRLVGGVGAPEQAGPSDRVGDDGITLTGAGYLPPVHVAAAAAELGLAAEWIGKHNREIQTPPVLHLRESAQKMGLLRKHRGKLLVTARGRRLRADPIGLWRHVAERALAARDECETQAGLILLIGVAAGVTDDLDALVARTLHAIGWMRSDGSPITSGAAAWDTKALLRRMGGLTGDSFRREERPTPEGITFARAALGAPS